MVTDNRSTRRLRGQLVDGLVADGHIRDRRVADALRAVPRHIFLPELEPERAYSDEALATKWDADGRALSSSSQPAMMAIMLEQLGAQQGHRVLEIGAGTGYNAALLAHLVGDSGSVVSVELDDDLVVSAREHLAAAHEHLPADRAARATVVCGDGALGWPAAAPYDRIILSVGASDLAPAWLEQLAVDGRLVLPLALHEVQRSIAFERVDDHLESRSLCPCGFMQLRGSLAGPDRARQLGDGSGIFVVLDDAASVDDEAQAAALAAPGADIVGAVRVDPSDLLGSLGLWLALREPRSGALSAIGPAADRGPIPWPIVSSGYARAPSLIGDRGLAALLLVGDDGAGDEGRLWPRRRRPRLVGARPFGAEGDELARRLLAQVDAWDAAGRPPEEALRISAHPRAPERSWDIGPVVGPDAVVDLPHARLALRWAEDAGR